MTALWEDLDAALAAGEATRARRCVHALDAEAPAVEEDLLTALARRAATGSGLATELLLERVEETGVLRRFAAGAARFFAWARSASLPVRAASGLT